MSLLLGMVGVCYVVLLVGFWSLGRMSALSDKFAANRAKVIPFHRS